MINTCCVLTNWQGFIIMSWRLRAVRKAAETVYETQRCGSATAATIISTMANLYLSPRYGATDPRANVFYNFYMGRTDALQCESRSYALLQRRTTKEFQNRCSWHAWLSMSKKKSRSVKCTAKGVTGAMSHGWKEQNVAQYSKDG